ncbi:HEAT repeat domain-containing protein [Micromonospora sp. B006]|uniref:HEAT repeat domain-containing protein n=1 Tax=Micromonospora sp. B006 TaxID=2201999 RepID=UPI001CEF9BB8|nr:HEAT repeat domain-containing protein [Micromonospora sp. B006]
MELLRLAVGPENRVRSPWVARQDVAVIWGRRDGQALPASPVEEDGLLSVVRVAVEDAGAGRWEALDRLVDVLLEVDAHGDEVAARSALALVTAVPGLVVRLDEHARSAPWYGRHREPAWRRVAGRSSAMPSGPVATALASMHGDGRVRERAVAAMIARPYAEVMPFLVVRTADWVAPVRDRARAGLAVLLADDADVYLPAVLPMALRLEAWARAGFAVAQVRVAVLVAPEQLWRGLFASAGGRERRFVLDTVLARGGLRTPDLVTVAESDPDVRVRARAAEAACRDAVWTRRHDLLRRLARSARAEVRVVALTGLARAGQDADVAGHLDDEAPLVRAVARDAARRLGRDAREHYRAGVDADEPVVGAIAGLAETGSVADAPLLLRLLGHEKPEVRAQAVRGLRLLDAVVVGELVALVRDPSPAVVREVALALRPVAGALPPALLWELLRDGRVELRRAGYKLLRGRGAGVELQAALILVADMDKRLAERGKADAIRLARDAASTTWRRSPRPELRVTEAERVELLALAARAAARLGDETSQQLAGWVADSHPVE